MSLADELPAHGLFVAVKATPSSMSQMCSSLTHCLDGDLLGPLLCGAGLIQSITLLSCFPPPLRSQFSAFHNHYCFHGSLCDCMHPFWGFGQGPIHPKLQRELTKMGFGLIGVGFQISLNCVWFLLDHYAVRFAALFLAVIRVNLPKVHRFLFFGCVFFLCNYSHSIEQSYGSDNPVLDGHSQTEVWWGRIKVSTLGQVHNCVHS